MTTTTTHTTAAAAVAIALALLFGACSQLPPERLFDGPIVNPDAGPGDKGVVPDSDGALPPDGPAVDTDGPAPLPDGPLPPGTFDWRDAVLYFVLIDRFNDGNPSNNSPEPGVETPANWQGGDLAGVKAKITSGYFSDLGVNVLWLSSPIDAPTGKYPGSDGHDYTGYHGYWPTDLTKVEEHIGDKTLLKSVVDAAHTAGIKVIFDYVMNHVHEQSPTYLQNKGWFWPLDKNGTTCLCGGGCGWGGADGRRCWFDPFLPDFNFTLQAARSFSVGNAISWVKQTGIDGFRLDAIKQIETSWLIDLRSALKAQGIGTSGGRFYMVGETFDGDPNVIKAFVNPSTELDGQFDFPLRAVIVRTLLRRQGSLKELDTFMNSNDTFYGPGSIMSNFVGNHDLPRPIHLAEDNPWWDEWSNGKERAWTNQPAQPSTARPYERLATAFTLLFGIQGIPLIYYGDEIGLAGAGDPDNRRMMTWSGENQYQVKLRDHIKQLTKIRAAHPALRRGTRKQVWLGDDIYAFTRSDGNETLVVVINRSDNPQTIKLDHVKTGTFTDLLTNAQVSAANVVVPARGSFILQ